MDYTSELLSIDPIGEAEKLLGKHHSEFNKDDEMMALGLTVFTSKKVNEHLKSIKDTYWGMTWNEFKELVKLHGFEIGYKSKVNNSEYDDEAVLFYNKEKGLIIWAESYMHDSINGGTLHGFAKIPEDYKKLYSVLNCSHDAFADFNRETKQEVLKESVHFDMDVREGLFHKLSQIETVTAFKSKWSYKPFLWFLDYMATKDKNYDYKAITNEVIKNSCEEVKEIIMS